MIQIIADAQEARIIANERKLLDDLCAYRELLRIR